MGFKRFLLATIMGLVTMFTLSYFWHGVLLKDYYMSATSALPIRGEPVILYVLIAYLIISMVMADLYPRVKFEGGGRVTNGLRFGMTMAIMWVIPMQLAMLAVVDAGSVGSVCIDGLWHLAEEGIGGIVMAFNFAR